MKNTRRGELAADFKARVQEAIPQPVGHPLRRAPHRVVDDERAGLGLVVGPLGVLGQYVGDVLAPDDAVARGYHVDGQARQGRERLLDLVAVRHHDVGVVLRCFGHDSF